jgi:GMP synthase-like glutamine amidotransferase
MGVAMTRILVLEQERETPAALFEDWALARGHELRTLSAPQIARWPHPREADAVVSLGSELSVARSPERWIARELDFLRASHDAGVPVLGICFGGQALAKALGGEVTRGARIELSWRTLESRETQLIAPGPWLRWHEDVFTVPPGGRLIASDGAVPLAFAHGASVGVQFHPEADAAVLGDWIESSRQRLAEHTADVERLQRQARRHAPGARARAYELFDRIARLWPAPAQAARSAQAPIRR